MSQSLKAITKPLIQWFEENKRPLPWREGRDPYRVWISEIMLQQTRIEAVKSYYARFITALPDVKSLSEINDDALLKLWEGLGYYSRARNLKKAAITIMTEYGGVFPKSFDQLRKLSGIGDYTAAAIASICFDEKVPAVDGNVLRVIARIRKNRENVLLPETKKRVFSELLEIMPDQAGAFNEALMELGETVCLPNGAPSCENCPIREYCAAYREHLTEELPVRIKKVKRKKENKSVFFIRSRDNRVAIEKRPDKGLLPGMYQLPNIEGFHSEKSLHKKMKEWDLDADNITFIKDAKHIFTHIDWYMKGYRVSTTSENNRFIWVTEEELRSDYPLPTAFLKLLK
ncbi:MAG: A/G-specific adenine glycosylase [Ruminococcus sp.]|nr:A/G-specific adenine glycosylase [Ruminococcus sp.]